MEQIAIARSSSPLLLELGPPRAAPRRPSFRPLPLSRRILRSCRSSAVPRLLLRRQLDVPRPRQGRGRRDRQCRGDSLVRDAGQTEFTRPSVELGVPRPGSHTNKCSGKGRTDWP